MQHPKTRALIRAVSVGSSSVVFEIPDWKPNKWFEMNILDVPYEQRKYLHPGFRCFVSINIDAERVEALNICEWRL